MNLYTSQLKRGDDFRKNPSEDSVNVFRESIFESFSEVHDPRILSSAVLLISERTVDGKTSVERRKYISSLPADARRTAYAIRSHWGIESCHWISRRFISG